MQIDSMFGSEDSVAGEGRRPGEVWSYLESEQNQGDGHLQLQHGKLLPDAVPVDTEGEGSKFLE